MELIEKFRFLSSRQGDMGKWGQGDGGKNNYVFLAADKGTRRDGDKEKKAQFFPCHIVFGRILYMLCGRL
ncbi:MAG: hypothetical protein AB9834_17800 [Lentimicrobium sp.]